MDTAQASAPAPPIATTRRLAPPEVMAAVLAFLAVAPVAAGQGGYYPVSWGWMGIAYAWAGAMAIVLRGEIRIARTEAVFVGGAFLLTVWTAASLLWTSSTTNTVYEIERTLAYLTFAAALVVIGERRSALGLLVGTWAAITVVACYSLGTRLAPARFGLYIDPLSQGRLFQPLGYWNALGIFAAMGLALALGLADRPGRLWLRIPAAASIAPLAATTYFTFSRGAWLALVIGAAAVFLVSPHRLRYALTALVVVPAPAAAVAYAASQPQLTAASVNLAAVGAPGRRAALVIAVAALISAALMAALAAAGRRVSVGRTMRRGFSAALVCLALAVAGVGTVHYGSPISAARRAYDSLLTSAPPTGASDLNNRLLSLSLNGRLDLWRGGLHQFRAHPLTGGGAGTFGAYWLAHRPYASFVVDTHSLYLETLGELGVVGLLFLLALVATPMVAAVRRRGSPMVSVVLGAYVAYLAHAVVDWDWEVPAVTLVALTLAAALLLGDRDHGIRLGAPVQRAALAAFIAAALVAGLGLVSNRALSDGSSALSARNYASAISDASTARRFAPWSDAPYILAGRAELSQGHVAAANRDFAKAIHKEPTDWVAWEWRMQVTIGAEHAQAVARLKALDPLYDFTNGRP